MAACLGEAAGRDRGAGQASWGMRIVWRERDRAAMPRGRAGLLTGRRARFGVGGRWVMKLPLGARAARASAARAVRAPAGGGSVCRSMSDGTLLKEQVDSRQDESQSDGYFFGICG